ncbi:hypothetical protein ACLMJK_000779 [Lecanora helva]
MGSLNEHAQAGSGEWPEVRQSSNDTQGAGDDSGAPSLSQWQDQHQAAGDDSGWAQASASQVHLLDAPDPYSELYKQDFRRDVWIVVEDLGDKKGARDDPRAIQCGLNSHKPKMQFLMAGIYQV